MKLAIIFAALFLPTVKHQTELERMYDDVRQVLMIEYWQGQ